MRTARRKLGYEPLQHKHNLSRHSRPKGGFYVHSIWDGGNNDSSFLVILHWVAGYFLPLFENTSARIFDLFLPQHLATPRLGLTPRHFRAPTNSAAAQTLDNEEVQLEAHLALTNLHHGRGGQGSHGCLGAAWREEKRIGGGRCARTKSHDYYFIGFASASSFLRTGCLPTRCTPTVYLGVTEMTSPAWFQQAGHVYEIHGVRPNGSFLFLFLRRCRLGACTGAGNNATSRGTRCD